MAKVIKRFWDGDNGPLYREGDDFQSPNHDRMEHLTKLGFLEEEKPNEKVQHRRKTTSKKSKTDNTDH